MGRAAIADRKRVGVLGVSSAAITVTRSFAFGDQVIAAWVLTGIPTGYLWGYPATGQSIHMQGLTVVTLPDGKITKASLYDAAAAVRRQLTRAR